VVSRPEPLRGLETIEFEQWSVVCTVSQADALALFRELDQKYRSCSWALLRAIGSLANEPDEEVLLRQYPSKSSQAQVVPLGQQPITSDLFLPQAECVLHVLIESIRVVAPESTVLVVSGVWVRNRRPSTVDEFLTDMMSLLRERGLASSDSNFEERTTAVCYEALEGLANMEVPSTPLNAEQLRGSLGLLDEGARLLLREIKKRDPAFCRNYVGKEDNDSLIESLTKSGNLEKQIAAICRKDSAVRLRARNAEELSGPTQTCTACGESIGKHKTDEVFVVTELGKRLIEKSRWMGLLVVYALLELGIAPEAIRIPKQDAPDDPIDLAFCLDNNLHIVEMTDGNFDEQDAARFAPRLRKPQRANAGLIVCTGTVTPEAEEFMLDLTDNLLPGRPRLQIFQGADSPTRHVARYVRYARYINTVSRLPLHGVIAGLDPLAVLFARFPLWQTPQP